MDSSKKKEKVQDQIAQLSDKIDECETTGDFDKGFEIANEILKLDGSNVQALLVGASCLVSRSGSEKDDLMAKEWYVKAIELEPDKGYGKYFAYAQLVDGMVSIELYNRGLSILNVELGAKSLSQEDLAKLKADKIDALQSQVEVYLADLSDDQDNLIKARQISHDLLQGYDEKFTPPDIFLLAQIYDKLGSKYKSEIKELCEAAARRILCFPPHKEADADTSAVFITKMAKFCLDYGFINITSKLLHRLRDVGGETLEYFSLKALYYRVKCNDAMKNAHSFANSCLEELEVMEADGEMNDDDAIDEIKQTMNEIKNQTPVKLDKLFGDVKNGQDQGREEEEEGEDDYEEFSDEEDVFPLTTFMKVIQKTKKYKNIFEREEKRILGLCLLDLESTVQNQMEVE